MARREGDGAKGDEVPGAVRQVMKELASGMASLPDLTEEQYGELFTQQQGKGNAEAWCKLRLQVLEMVGTCATLTSLDLSLVEMRREGEVEALCRGLRSNPVLVDLRLSYNRAFKSAAACKRLAPLLRCSKSLQVLLLNGVDMAAEGLAHLVQALQTNSHCRLHYLDLSCNRALGDAGAKLIGEMVGGSGSPSLKTLMMQDVGLGRAGTQFLARALARNGTLKELFLGDEGVCGQPLLATLLRPLMQQEAMEHNRSISTLDVLLADEEGLGSVLAKLLRTTTSLRSLSLRHSRFSRLEWQLIFRSLHANSSLQYLDLSNCKGLDCYLFPDLMDLLDANSCITTLKLDHTPWHKQGKWMHDQLQETALLDLLQAQEDEPQQLEQDAHHHDLDEWGNHALVHEAQRRHAHQDAYLSVLRDNKLRFVPAKTGRLFICGSHLAGKTSLRKSMVRCSLSTASWLQKVVIKGRSLIHQKQSACMPPWVGRGSRSKGLEVELLRDDAEMQILVWDSAGEAEFQALHDYLFPDINQPCVFLFVFSLFDYTTGAVKVDAESELERELLQWLKFVASSRSRGQLQAKMSVVLSHVDRVAGWTPERMVDWASETVDRLRHKFEGVVDLSASIHALSGLSGRCVRPLMDHVFGCFKELFSNHLPVVPEACHQLSLLLAEWAASHTTQPILRTDDFFSLCASKLDQLRQLVQDDSAWEGRQAVAAYLHDLGSIIHFVDLNMVVVNPNWLAHIFLGRLVRLGDQVQGSVDKSFQGFVARQELEEMVEEFLRLSRYSGFHTSHLLSLMLKLELCYEEAMPGGTTRIFIPSALEDHHGMASAGLRHMSWPLGDEAHDAQCIYLGRRLQCVDPQRTALTAAFFPRFQVRLRHRLMCKLGRQPDVYRNERNLVSLVVEGMEMLVETREAGDFVDIMVRSSKTAMETLEFVRQVVMKELQRLCPRTCPGVELEEGILRPDCVRHLTLCYYRHKQAVLVEELQAELMHQLMEEESVHREEEETFSMAALLEVEHAWSEDVEAGLSAGSHTAVELLGARDVMRAIECKLRILTAQRAHIEEAATQVLAAPATAGQQQPGRMSLSERQKRLLRRVENRRNVDKEMVDRFLRVSKQVVEERKELHVLMQAMLPEVKGLQRVHKEVVRTLGQRMNQVMGFSAHMHFRQRNMPRFPYFTDTDVGMLQRFTAVMRVGKSVRLHFMCEERSGKHYVMEQTGCDMTLEDGKWRRLRPIAMGATKLLYILLHAGLPMPLPLPLPVLGSASSLALDSLLQDIRANEPATPPDFNDAWLCLHDFLRPRMDLISSLFQLYHVRYTRGNTAHLAWVCKACRQNGLHKDLLQDHW